MRSFHLLFFILFFILLCIGCATTLPEYRDNDPRYRAEVREWSVLNGVSMDHELEERVLALDPENIKEEDIK